LRRPWRGSCCKRLLSWVIEDMQADFVEEKNNAVQGQDGAALKRGLLKKLPWLLLLPLGLLLPALAEESPWLVESIYSRGVYPHISRVMGWVSGLAGFSVAEFFIIGFVLTVAGLLIYNTARLLMRRISPLRFLSFLLSLLILAGVMLNLFYLCWGFNYSRPTLYQLMGLEVKERADEELHALCLSLAAEANRLCAAVPRDGAGVFEAEDYRRYFELIPHAYGALAEKHGLFSGEIYPAKGVLASEAMSWAGISGIFIPYTAEANVNVHQPSLLLLSSAAHENAHALGFAKEDEANFIAYLACAASEEPAIAYSGVMLALIHCGNKLYDSDPEKYVDVYRRYDQALLKDIRDYNAYWKAYEGQVEEAFDAVNDGYLKFNHQEDGVKSYGMMVDLMLAYAAKYGI